MYIYFDEVRDSQLDVQGIVNNSVYLNYFEHARHKSLNSMGADFINLSQQGLDLVVADLFIQFKSPLKSADKFIITSEFILKSPVRVVAQQNLYKISADLISDVSFMQYWSEQNSDSLSPQDIINFQKKFLQKFLQKSSQKSSGLSLFNQAKYTIVCIKSGKPIAMPDSLANLF